MNGDTPESLRNLAHHCRRLALAAGTAEVASSLNDMAESYDRRAAEAEEARARSAAPPESPASETR